MTLTLSVEKVSGKDANSYMVMLRMAEVLMEACPQAVLGNLQKMVHICKLDMLSNVNLYGWEILISVLTR